LREKEYWPMCATVYAQDHTLRIASVWTPSPFKQGTPVSDIDMTPARFEAKLESDGRTGDGYPYCVSTYPVGDSYQVAALFAPLPNGGLGNWCRFDRTQKEYEEFLTEFRARGYRPITVSVCPVLGQPRFSAVMIEDDPK